MYTRGSGDQCAVWRSVAKRDDRWRRSTTRGAVWRSVTKRGDRWRRPTNSGGARRRAVPPGDQWKLCVPPGSRRIDLLGRRTIDCRRRGGGGSSSSRSTTDLERRIGVLMRKMPRSRNQSGTVIGIKISRHSLLSANHRPTWTQQTERGTTVSFGDTDLTAFKYVLSQERTDLVLEGGLRGLKIPQGSGWRSETSMRSEKFVG